MTGFAGTCAARVRGRFAWIALLAIGCCMLAAAGASSARADTTTYTADQTIPVPPASNFTGNSGGDGWNLAMSPTQVFNVFHHQSTLQVSCHEQTDASNCWPTDPETITDGSGDNFATSGQPGVFLDQTSGHLYVFATRTSDDTGGVVCIDTTQAATNTNPFCGFTALTAVGDASMAPGWGQISDPMQVGSKVYAFNYVQGSYSTPPSGTRNTLLCFDLTTAAACTGQPFTVNLGSGASGINVVPEPGAAVIGSEIIIPSNDSNDGDVLGCFDASTQGACAGSWPVSSPAGTGSYGSPMPMLGTTGALTGFCLPNGSDPCFNLDGTSAATPSGMTSAITDTSGWNGEPLTVGARVYVPNVNTNSLECYDFSTDASCTNFPVYPSNLGGLYTVNRDPQRPTCLWLNADNGSAQIQNVDAYTGGPCGQGPLRALASQFVVNTPACTPATYQSLQITSPAPADYASGTITFEDADGNPISGVPTLPLDATGTASLTGLGLNTSGGLPQFLITLNDVSGPTSSVGVELKWSGTTDPSCLPTPVNSSPPSISGSPKDGQTLTANPGVWTRPSTYGYQWYDCAPALSGTVGSGCTPIANATGSTYVIQGSDVGQSVEVAVTATSDGYPSDPAVSTVIGPVTAGAASRVEVSMSQSAIYADGTSQTTAMAIVTDRYGAPISGDTLHFTTSGSQTVGTVTDDGDGVYTAPITASTTPGTVSVDATDTSSLATPSGGTTFTQTPVAAAAADISLKLGPSAILADGYSTSVATATVTDASGDPVVGDDVTIASSTGASQVSTVTPGPAPGEYQATITSTTTAGPVTVTGTDTSVESLSTTATLTQKPGPAASVNVVLGTPSITADGSSTTTATATVKDANGNPVSGDTVTINADGSQQVSSVTAGSTPGTYQATITATTTAGLSTVTATDTTGAVKPSGTATLTETAGPATTVALQLSPASIVADGRSTSTATATVEDANGNPVSGDTVTIGSAGSQQVSSVTAGGTPGTYRATITSTTIAGRTAITATDTSVLAAPSQSANLTQTADHAEHVSVVLGTPSITADGSSTTTATATVKDADGNPVSGDTVTINSDGSQQVSSVTTGSTPGTYQATITASTTAGPSTITATDTSAAGSPAGTATLTQTAGPAAAVALQLSPSSIVADGRSTSTATATVDDANGNPVSSDPVTITSAGSQLVSSVTAGGTPGTYQATITSTTTAGHATITATDASLSQTATLTQTPDRAEHVSVVLGTPSITADGHSTTLATATVTDQNGNAITGDPVAITADGGQQVSAVTAGSTPGTYRATITSTTTAGRSTVTATDGPASGTAALTETAGPATRVALKLSPASIVADGRSTSTVTATVSDANGNPVSGDTLTIGSAGSQQVSSVTAGSTPGTYQATITSTTAAGQATITATDTTASPHVSQTTTLTQTASAATHLAVALSPSTLTAGGSSTTTATVTLTDLNGNPISGDTVTIASSGGQQVSSVTPGSTPGTYQATITSSGAAGQATITATDTSAPQQPTASSTLTQVAGAIARVGIKLEPAAISADGSAGTVALVTVTDADGNPISGAPVTITSSGGQTISSVIPGLANGTYEAAITSTTEPGLSTITATSSGASAAATLAQVDVTAPVIVVHSPLDGGVYLQGAQVAASYACIDQDNGVSDVARCAGPAANGAPLDTRGVGSHTFIVNTLDRSGNRARVAVHYDVVAPSASSGNMAPFVYDTGRVDVSSTSVSLPLGCDSGKRACQGSITLRLTTPTTKGANGTYNKFTYLGTIHYRLKAGATNTFAVPVNAVGRQLVDPNEPIPTIIVTTAEHGPAAVMTLSGGR